jgi:hypothetical protein
MIDNSVPVRNSFLMVRNWHCGCLSCRANPLHDNVTALSNAAETVPFQDQVDFLTR